MKKKVKKNTIINEISKMMMMYNQCAMFKNMGATITEIYYN